LKYRYKKRLLLNLQNFKTAYTNLKTILPIKLLLRLSSKLEILDELKKGITIDGNIDPNSFVSLPPDSTIS
jgi:hypothetical protein